MALPSIMVADFVGEIRLSQDAYGAEAQQDFIDEKYPELIREILGDYAFVEIRDAVTLPLKWDDLLNGVGYYKEEVLFLNDGLVKACKYWLWYQLFVQDFQNTPTGNVVNLNENSTRLSGGAVSSIAATRWNKGANLIAKAYAFIDNFKKVETEINLETDNGDGTYTFLVVNTKYLAVGDKVYSSGIELTVTAIVEDAEITAEAGVVGLSFSSTVYWEPFKKYKMPMPLPIKSSAI